MRLVEHPIIILDSPRQRDLNGVLVAGDNYKGGSRALELDGYHWAGLMGGGEKERKKRGNSEQQERVVS